MLEEEEEVRSGQAASVKERVIFLEMRVAGNKLALESMESVADTSIAENVLV